MSPIRSFSAGIITTLLVMGALTYWYLPHLRVVSGVPSSHLSGPDSRSPLSGASGASYVTQPFATPLSTDCSVYETKQRIVCEADLANTIYSQFVMLSSTQQLAYDCTQMRVDTQQKYCEDRKLAIPLEQQKSKILEKVRQEGISACDEFGSGSLIDQCQLDVALGRLTPTGLSAQSGTLVGSGQFTRPTPPIPHCEILDGDLRVRCEREMTQIRGSSGDTRGGILLSTPSDGPSQQ